MNLKNILIFAGTTEGREVSELLAARHIRHTVCVATEYGETVFPPNPFRFVHCGRMNGEDIKSFLLKEAFDAVVDATHPYAREVTRNIRTAMEGTDIPYLRFIRETETESAQEKVSYFSSNEECAQALETAEGNILLTTGSKELAVYCSSGNLKSRLYVRVLPSLESIASCMEQGLSGRQIIAMQGPFTEAMNEAIFRQYKIACMVTKESGKQGGFLEKLKAAKKAGIRTFVIGREEEEQGYSFCQLCEKLGEICGQTLKDRPFLWITLAGFGMGDRKSLTRETAQAIEEADILLGAKRILDSCDQNMDKKPFAEKIPFYQAERIIPYLRQVQQKQRGKERIKAVILFSGDSGFYSGCRLVYQALKEEIRSQRLKAALHILPGISSVSYLSACLGESWEDGAIYSIHGKGLPNLAGKIRRQEKTFLLMSGVKDMNRLGEILVKESLSDCQITAGYQLSYEDQQIERLTPEECCRLKEEGLYTCLIKNPRAVPKTLSPCISDDQLLRSRIPMTKEEIRHISICKLRLHKKSVLYDIGSGTGSIAVEAAGMSDEIQVFAIERREEAVDLIRRNQEKFGLDNIFTVRTEAPEGLDGLPAATHAFIGGSGGRLKEIVAALYRINPHMQVVVNAITMETVCAVREILDGYPLEYAETIQMQVNRTKEAGSYHLMQAENPVWISTFRFEAASEEGIWADRKDGGAKEKEAKGKRAEGETESNYDRRCQKRKRQNHGYLCPSSGIEG